MEKLPPVEKVYEAWTALVDDRYDLSPEALIVRSSDGSKEYRVTWDDEERYRSNDNATFWQGYAGYPVIMALMLQGRVPFNGEVAAWFKGIPWKALNDAHKRDYAAALAEAFECDVNDLPLSMVLSWYEQKAVCILLTLLHLGIKNIYLGPILPAFLSPNVVQYLVDTFQLHLISNAEDDIKTCLKQEL